MIISEIKNSVHLFVPLFIRESTVATKEKNDNKRFRFVDKYFDSDVTTWPVFNYNIVVFELRPHELLDFKTISPHFLMYEKGQCHEIFGSSNPLLIVNSVSPLSTTRPVADTKGVNTRLQEWSELTKTQGSGTTVREN